MSLFWLLHSAYAAQTAQEASEARSAARGATYSAKQIAEQLDRTILACEAMWSILRDKLGVSDEELVARVNELDLTDGKLDGKMRKAMAVQCATCQRTVSKRFSRCMYCGNDLERDVFA